MAFRRPTDDDRLPFYAKGTVDRKPPFRATGQGLSVVDPGAKAASEITSNASLSANVTAANGSKYLEKIYLYVARVSTGWSLSGDFAQALKSRSFYPRNLSQGDFVIEGICPSQDEYDKLVEFVQAHHLRIVDDSTDQDFSESADQTESVKFRMAPSGRPGTYRHAPKISWDVAVTNIAAGHERFKFQPAFTLTCKVLNDDLQGDDDVEFDIMTNLEYKQVFTDAFGDLYHPTATGPAFSAALAPDTQTKWDFTGGGNGEAGTGGGGGGGCDRAAVFGDHGDGKWGYSSDTEYMEKNNPMTGSNFAPGVAAPVKFPGGCRGPGSDNAYDGSYIRDGVDGAGNRYDDKGLKR
jgi:hypothetical protein